MGVGCERALRVEAQLPGGDMDTTVPKSVRLFTIYDLTLARRRRRLPYSSGQRGGPVPW